MAEPFSIATGALQVAGAGISLAKTLYEYLESVKSAQKHVKAIAVEVRLTSSVLEHLGALLKDNEEEKLCSQNVVSDAKSAFKGCEDAFREVDDTFRVLVKPQADGTRGVSVAGRLSWPFKKGKLETLQANLERLKTTLLLMLSVLSYAREKALKVPAATPQLVLEKLQIQNLIKAKDDATERYERLLYDFASLATDEGQVGQATEGAGARAEPRPEPGFLPDVEDATHAPNPDPPPYPALSFFRAPSDTVSSDQRDEVLNQLHMCTSAVSHLASTVNSAAVHWTQFRRFDDTRMMGSIRLVMQNLTQLRTMAKHGTATPPRDTTRSNGAQQSSAAQVGALQQSTASRRQDTAASYSRTLTHQQAPAPFYDLANSQEAQEARIQEAQTELAQWRQAQLERFRMMQRQSTSDSETWNDPWRQLKLLEHQKKKRGFKPPEGQSGIGSRSGTGRYGQSVPVKIPQLATRKSSSPSLGLDLIQQPDEEEVGSHESGTGSAVGLLPHEANTETEKDSHTPVNSHPSVDPLYRTSTFSPTLGRRGSEISGQRLSTPIVAGNGAQELQNMPAQRAQYLHDHHETMLSQSFQPAQAQQMDLQGVAVPVNPSSTFPSILSEDLNLDFGAADQDDVLDSFDFESFLRADDDTGLAQKDRRPKDILKTQTQKVPDHPNVVPQGVAPLENSTKPGVPPPADPTLLDFDGGQSAPKRKTSLRRTGPPRKSHLEDDISLDLDLGLEFSQPEKSVRLSDDFIAGSDVVLGTDDSDRHTRKSDPYLRGEKRYAQFDYDSQENEGENSSVVKVQQGSQPLEATPQSRDTVHGTRAHRDVGCGDRDVLLPLAPMKAMRQRVLTRKRSASGPMKSAVSKKRKTLDTAYSHRVNADDINDEDTADTVDQTLGLLDSVDELVKRWTTVGV